TDDLATKIKGLRRGDMLAVLANVAGADDEAVEKIKEDWLFRGMKSLFLQRLDAGEFSVDLAALSAAANAANDVTEEFDGHLRPYGFTFDYSDNVVHEGKDVVELGYRYSVNVVLL